MRSQNPDVFAWLKALVTLNVRCPRKAQIWQRFCHRVLIDIFQKPLVPHIRGNRDLVRKNSQLVTIPIKLRTGTRLQAAAKLSLHQFYATGAEQNKCISNRSSVLFHFHINFRCRKRTLGLNHGAVSILPGLSAESWSTTQPLSNFPWIHGIRRIMPFVWVAPQVIIRITEKWDYG